MIGDLKPYAEYKDSGLPWLGQVPAHWDIKRLGSVFAERGETNELREVTEILSVLKDRGVIPYSEKGRIGNKASDDIGRYKIVRPDDLVVNCMNVIIGSLGRSRFTGCLSPVYYVLRRRDEKYDPSYLELVFRNKQFHESLIRIGNGILAHRMRIPMEKLKSELIPLPPPTEQAAIVRFLDWANGRLERAIQAKRKVIALLNEQKQAIIHRAVTRGLDPSIPLKPSGIPWIGEIPEHWEVMAAKRVCSIVRDGTHLPPPRTETGFPLLSVRNVINGRLVRRNDDSHISAVDFQSLNKSFDVRVGDVILAVVGATLGKVAIVEDIGPFQIQRSLGILRPRKDVVTARYLARYLRSPQLQQHLWRSVAFSAQPGIYVGFVSNLPIPLPPSVTEQDDLCNAIDVVTQPINTTISRLEREITLLFEYRTRLVADVVTGKLDVREAGSRLPDEELLPDLAAADDDPDYLPIEEEDAA